MTVRTSVVTAFVPTLSRLLIVRLLPGDDRAEIIHKSLGIGGARDAAQQFAPGVEHEVERNRTAAVFLQQFAARGFVRVVLAATNRWSMNSPTSLREKTCFSIIRHGGHQLA